jgi:hypothetical protein
LSEKPEVTGIEWLHQLNKIEQGRLIPNQVVRATCNVSPGMTKGRARQTQTESTVNLDMSGKPRAHQKMDEIPGNVRSDRCGIRISES